MPNAFYITCPATHLQMRKKRDHNDANYNDDSDDDFNDSNPSTIVGIIAEEDIEGQLFYQVKLVSDSKELESWKPAEKLKEYPNILKEWNEKKKRSHRKKPHSSSDSEDGDYIVSQDEFDYDMKKKKKPNKKTTVHKIAESNKKKTKIGTRAKHSMGPPSNQSKTVPSQLILPTRKAVLSDIKEEKVDITNIFDFYAINLDDNSPHTLDSIVGLKTPASGDPTFSINNDLYDLYSTENRKKSKIFIQSVFPEECDIGTVSFTTLSTGKETCTLPTDLVASCYNRSLSNYYETKFLDSLE